jgi:hypothetical protein
MTEPTFQSIFGAQWDELPPVMHKHYANRPFTDDVIRAEGLMEVRFNRFIRLLSPILKFTGALVPHEGVDIPTVVRFKSEQSSNAFCLDRCFYIPRKKPYIFFSRLVPQGGDIVVEYMRFGIGWRHRFYYDGQKVILEHRGYVWRLFGCNIPIPLGVLLGHGYAEEQAIDETHFRMRMSITHPWWGLMYEYKGEFEVKG